MPDKTTAIAAGLEFGLLVAGAILWWRIRLSPDARQRAHPPSLAVWNISVGEFLLLTWFICVGGFVASFSARLILNHYSLGPDGVIVVGTAASQIGIISGMVVFKTFFARAKSPPPPPKQKIFRSGVATFLLAMPLVMITILLWLVFLNAVGLPAEKQDLIRMFLEVKSPAILVLMMILACVGAPIMEE